MQFPFHYVGFLIILFISYCTMLNNGFGHFHSLVPGGTATAVISTEICRKAYDAVITIMSLRSLRTK